MQGVITTSVPAAAAAAKSLQSCPTLCDPHKQQPTRLPRPWDSPGKDTGVGCHFLLQRMKVKSESEVAFVPNGAKKRKFVAAAQQRALVGESH